MRKLRMPIKMETLARFLECCGYSAALRFHSKWEFITEMISVISLTNMVSQELAPGQSLIFSTPVMHSGKCECFRPNSGAVILRAQNAIYEVHFSANIGATAPGEAQLSIEVNGSPIFEGTMISTTVAAGDLNNVSRCIPIRTCGCGSETITIVNTGETTITVENPSLFVKRDA